MGAKEIVGTGDTLAGRVLFSDPDVSFASIRENAILRITSGPNVGRYRVLSKQALISGVDATPRAYTTSSAASGTLTAIAADVVEDTSQDWGTMPLDTTITITEGPNTGTYRLDTVLGPTGGPVGQAGVSGTQVRLSPTILKVDRRMVQPETGQSYEVDVDRLGVRVPQTVTGEDASMQFWL